MKLALITGEFPPMQGGVGDYTRELARELGRREISVSVITQRVRALGAIDAGRPSLRREVGVKGTPVSDVGGSDDVGEGKSPFVLQYTNLRSFSTLARVDALTRESDLVHVQYQAAAYGMTLPIHLLPRYLRWRKPARKVLVTFHDLKVPYLFPKAGALRRQLVMLLARTCEAVVVTNPEDLQTLTAELAPVLLQAQAVGAGSRRRVVRLIPIGSNIDPTAGTPVEREQTRASLGVQPDEILLCYFGFLSASKGGETLMRVLAEVVRAGYNARLLMLGGEVGASDPTNIAYAQRVRAVMDELGLRERVLWAGYRPASEVSALWRASDIAVLPYADGVSLRRGTLMAAFAHALPVVSTGPRAPVPELCDGENILLAPPGDVDGLAQQVLALIRSPALRARLSRGAAELARQFSWPRIAGEHLELYDSIRI